MDDITLQLVLVQLATGVALGAVYALLEPKKLSIARALNRPTVDRQPVQAA